MTVETEDRGAPFTVHQFKPKASRSAKAPIHAPDDDRPVIALRIGELERTVDAAEAALMKADRGVYQRANALVTIGTARAVASDGQNVEARLILRAGEHRIAELLTAAARFEKWDGRSGAFVPANLPMNIVLTLMQRAGHYRFPPLSGLCCSPTIRHDGSLLTRPGYDRATGLVFDPGDCRFPAIPDRPRRLDAERALVKLKSLLDGFPFVGEADRTVAVAYLLTSVSRRALRTAPMFAFTAPVAGSGKSKLVDLGSVLATGREAGVISQAKNEEETEKRIASLLMAGVPVAIDNVEAGLGGDLLCQLLTQTTVRLRILGKSEVPELPTNVMVTATGNNLQVVGDMTRRTLICRLDPGVERPELREFSFEPVAEAKADRGGYVVAALTILRAFHLAGRPQQAGAVRLGSFEEWSDFIRGALLWLGGADPVDTIEQGRACDPKLEALRAVAEQWTFVFGSTSMTCADVIKRASERHVSFDEGRGDFKEPMLREALLGVANDGGLISPVKLGFWLRKNRGRVVDERRFDSDPGRAGVVRWRLA